MTEQELQTCVNSVLSALRSNSRTIDQLTAVETLGDADYFEISGGKKVAFSVLSALIGEMNSVEQDSLKSLIEKNVLKAVRFDVTESTAKLEVSSVGKSITAIVPVATSTQAGIITAADKLKIENALSSASLAQAQAEQAIVKAESATETAGLAIESAEEAKETASQAVEAAQTSLDELKPRVESLEDWTKEHTVSVSLETESGYISADGTLIDNEESNGGSVIVAEKYQRSGLIRLCSGVFNFKALSGTIGVCKYMNGKFVSRTIYDTNTASVTFNDERVALDSPFNQVRIIVKGALISKGAVTMSAKADTIAAVLNFNKADKESLDSLADTVGGKADQSALETLNINFSDLADSVGQSGGIAPLDDDAQIPEYYLANARDVVRVAVWTDSATVEMPTAIGLYYYNANSKQLFISVRTMDKLLHWKETGIKTDTIYINTEKHVPYIWENGAMVPIAPEDTPASIFNATTQVPISGYYVLCDPDNATMSAVHAAWNAGKAVSGLIISFEIAAGLWKTYQYVGKTVTEGNWQNTDNWKDFGSLAAGSEPYIIIDSLVGSPTAGTYYNLQSAVQALIAYQNTTKVAYAKRGLIISYTIGENKMETKQFQGAVSDFGETALWKDFGGGGGSDVKTSDTPASGGTDAFSTGGAYKHLIVSHSVVQEDGTVTIQPLNADGEEIGDPITFLAAQGGGGESSGTIVAIAFENTPLYGALGSTIASRAAIRSVTMVGSVESENTIDTLELIDRDTNLTVWSERVNKPSSGDVADFSFDIDFTQFFTAAGSRRFKLVATDDGGHTGSKNITVTAEDITVTCEQVLQYQTDNAVTPDTLSVSIPMYKFGNNQSDKGILAKVDMYIGNEWKNIHSSTINDSFTHSITISPKSLRMVHGSYLIRIYGTSVASGVIGNTYYSSILCVDESKTTPVVAIRYNDTRNGTIRLYDTLSVDIAAYKPGDTSAVLTDVRFNGTKIAQVLALPGRTYNVSKQISGYAHDGSQTISIHAISDRYMSGIIKLIVKGTAVDVELKPGAALAIDFASRNNDESDHTISDGDTVMTVNGANWSSNGFVSYLGEKALRIAENMTASLPYCPFAPSSLESSGMAWQMKFATRNIRDKDAMLMECYDEANGAGFYIKGNKVGIYCKNGVQALEERSFRCGEAVTLGIVIEPSTVYVERGGTRYAAIKMYLDGEEVAMIGYIPGSGNLYNSKGITFNGTEGDLYVYYMLAYKSHYEWAQAFNNYLAKLTDTAAMVQEYDYNNVLISQTAEGSTAMRPSAAELWNRGIPYVVEVASEDEFDKFDGDVNTSENFSIDLYYYFPAKPWRSFKATGVRKRRQGTTSAKRPKKNPRYYLSKASFLVPLFPDYDNDDALLSYELMKLKKVRVGDNTIPVDLITIKIDYSDSSNANDCSVCNMMNATYRSLGGYYLTPAQRFFDGTWRSGSVSLTGLEMNHSTANHPVAIFRSTSDTLQNVYFEAKGNWKEDKGEQVALGFKDTPGYNKGCINYGEGAFVEFYGEKGETLDAIESRFKSAGNLDTSKLYLLSQYCGRDYRFMRYESGVWKASAGSMKQVGGKWVITGDVLNPVTGFELLNYQGMCWWKGVSSVDDMMAMGENKSSWVQKLVDKGTVSATTFPAWTYYFECMVDDDQLAIDYALGKKCPYELYLQLKFMQSADYSTVAAFAEIWRRKAYKYMSPQSVMSYHIFTDYRAALDQRAKNMQPMWFLEDGCSVTDGVYSSSTDIEPLRMYLNKVYDCDTCDGQDNDGGQTCDPEVDPDKPSDDETGYKNPYAGWGSILFNDIAKVGEMCIDDSETTLALRTVAAAMRSCQTTVDGKTFAPFSPEGAMIYSIEQRIDVWPKVVCSYDGERKYIKYTATSDAIYFYALQGSRRTSLPQFFDTRWRVRDGYYQTGKFFSGVLSGRIACASGAKIGITAAATGYFGIGNDASGNLSEAVFLEKGQSHEFTNFSHEEGALLYLYQTDRMSRLDISQISLSAQFNFSVMSLVEELAIGGDGYTYRQIGSYAPLTSLPLGELPFLQSLDISNTNITSLDCTGCPRIEHINAGGGKLQSIALAETSPINDIVLPDTMTEIRLIGLPKLTYTGLSASDGLQIASLAAVQRLRIETSPNLNAISMLTDTLDSQSGSPVLALLRIAGMTLKGNADELLRVMELPVEGMDADGQRQVKPAIVGEYQLTTIREQYEIDEITAHFDGLSITTVIEAFIEVVDYINGEYYGGTAEVDTVTLDNIGGHFVYYNGETYDEYLVDYEEANKSLQEYISE